MRFLFSDKLHFHKRNFKSLIEFVEREASEVFYNEDHQDLCGLKGYYREHKYLLGEYLKYYKKLSVDELYSTEYRSINLYKASRAELLCFVATRDKFCDFNNDFNERDEFFWLFENFKEDLVLNICAARLWIDTWEEKLQKLPMMHKIIVFSGSTIYTKVLLEIFKRQQGDAYVAEAFFTGNEFYLERKNTHISNNSDLKFVNFTKSLSRKINDGYERERIKAHNKIRLSKNKNVTQPSYIKEEIHNGKKYLLIVGQVVNDFSIVENKTGIRNTLAFYKDLLSSLLKNTDKNVVFKAHPWERHNVNLKRPKTYDYLSDWVSGQSKSIRGRVFVTENYNLNQLLDKAECMITICSQAGLEAAYQGFKPIQMGNAFYGGQGFTSDYSSVEELLRDFANDNVSGLMTLDEFQSYEKFMTLALQQHLVSIHKSGDIRLREIFKADNYIGLIKNEMQEGWSKIIPEIKPNESIVKKAGKPQEVISVQLEKNILRAKRMKKLKENPRRYFEDSKHPVARYLAVFFKKK